MKSNAHLRKSGEYLEDYRVFFDVRLFPISELGARNRHTMQFLRPRQRAKIL